MKFQDQKEREETLDIMHGILEPIEKKSDLRTKKAIELSLRILNDTDIFKKIDYAEYCDMQR